MNLALLGLLVVVGLGTYLMRALPLLTALRREQPRERQQRTITDEALSLIGPSVIAALLVTSLLPAPQEEGFWSALALAIVAAVPAYMVARRTGSLGLTVIAGVACYWLLTLAATLP